MALEKKDLCNQVGKTLREIRLEKGLSIEKVALNAGLDYTQLSRIERGIINTSIFHIYIISKTLEIPMVDAFIKIK